MSGSESGTPRPGSTALNNMTLLKNESRIFKVPKAIPVMKKKNKSIVMEEDDYVEGIARIIQRDFFPDLEKLRAQNEYLEAAENKDYVRLQEITRKYTGKKPNTHSRGDVTPATFETPNERARSPVSEAVARDNPHARLQHEEQDELDDITKKHSLDSYLAKHTSEDNSSYERLIALETKKKALKTADQFEAEVTSAALVDAALVLPSIEQQADQTERPHELDTWKYTAKNYIMYVPDGESTTKLVKPELEHNNTRLHGDPFNTKDIKEKIEKSKKPARTGKIGVDGLCEDEAPTPASRGFVATPSPRPGAPGDDSPLMTWGEIEGTPFRLDGGDTPLPALGSGRSYRMLEWGARERIGLKLAEEAARKRRPTTPRMRTPTPRLGTDRLATMSPAARRLATKHLLTPHLKLTPKAATPKPTTPLASSNKRSATPKTAGNTKMDNLTDNLLQINVQRRLKAQDFFK